MAYNDNVNVRINDSALLLILPPQLRKTTQRHQIMCGFKICIQAGTYQESINNCHKQRLMYIKNNENSLTRG